MHRVHTLTRQAVAARRPALRLGASTRAWGSACIALAGAAAWSLASAADAPGAVPPEAVRATPGAARVASVDSRLACPPPAKPVAPPAPARQPGAALVPTAWPQDAHAFLRSHQWDPATALWTLKPDVLPPPGVLPREAVLASREAYLSQHRWQDGRGWLAMRHSPRNLASLTPTQRRQDLQHFAQTHRWDEASGQWQSRVAHRRGRPAVP